MTQKRYLVCISGGLDSVTLAAVLQKEGHDVRGLFVDRDQGNLEREKEAIAYFGQKLGIDVDQTSLAGWTNSYGGEKKLPAGDLPRNAMFILAAVPFAYFADAGYIAIGTNSDDKNMPDGKPEFITAMNTLFKVTDQPVIVEAPFLDRAQNKAGVARVALELFGDDIDRTWSCWKGLEKPCGDCQACRMREAAVAAARSASGVGG